MKITDATTPSRFCKRLLRLAAMLLVSSIILCAHASENVPHRPFAMWADLPLPEQWITEHVQADAQWFGNALVVEFRYSAELAAAMRQAGLILE